MKQFSMVIENGQQGAWFKRVCSALMIFVVGSLPAFQSAGTITETNAAALAAASAGVLAIVFADTFAVMFLGATAIMGAGALVAAVAAAGLGAGAVAIVLAVLAGAGLLAGTAAVTYENRANLARSKAETDFAGLRVVQPEPCPKVLP